LVRHHHFPISRETKFEQEERIKGVIEKGVIAATGSERNVLAR
jgi:hypothetical protein